MANANCRKTIISEARVALQFVLALALSVVFVLTISHYVPFNMDEFIVYNRFACWHYPFNRWNVMHMNCGAFDLSLPPQLWAIKLGLPLRSYSYVGNAMIVLYYPLFMLWSSPYSARLLGILMLLFQAVIAGRLFRSSWFVIFLGLLAWFPYCFQHLVDTGQISFQTTSVLLLLYLTRAWLLSIAKRRFVQGGVIAACLGLLLSFGVWIKLSYAFLLPAIGMMIAAELICHGKIISFSGRSLLSLLQMLLGLIFFAVPTAILLFSLDGGGHPYFHQFLIRGFKEDAVLLREMVRHFRDTLSSYLFNPDLAGHVVFSVPKQASILGIVAFMLLIFLFVKGMWLERHKRRRVLLSAIALAGSLTTLAAVSCTPASWAMHHVVLAYPFLFIAGMMLVAGMRKCRLTTATLAFFLALQMSSYCRLGSFAARLPVDSTRLPALNDFANKTVAQSHVILVVDWGMYFIKALYGPQNQLVIYVNALNSEGEIAQVHNILRLSGRKLAILSAKRSASNIGLLLSSFPALKEFDSGIDVPWRVFYEP